MKLKMFWIPAKGGEAATDEFNRFVASHGVVDIENAEGFGGVRARKYGSALLEEIQKARSGVVESVAAETKAE